MKALVLTLRGCHLGYLGCYGNGWIATPNVDRLAAQGVVFDQHLADVPDPVIARRTWRDGRHHFPVPEGSPETSATFDVIASLRAAGIPTLLIADGSRPVPEPFIQGWDEVELVRPDDPTSTLEQTLEVARAALEHLTPNKQWLLWVDLATLLPPWHVPADFSDPYFHDPASEEVEEEEEEEREEEEEKEDTEPEQDDPLTPWTDPPVGRINTEDDIDFCRLQCTYAGAMTYLDAGIGVLLEELDRLGLGNDCLVVLTSDHGQALGEHGLCGPYRPWLHDELLHIPLIMRLPNRASQGLRISALTQTVDLVPTLLAAFDLPLPPGLHGHNLLPLAREQPASTRSHACSGLQIDDAIEWCLRTPEWSLIHPVRTPAGESSRRTQLYVKPDDHWEVNDVVQHHLDRADAYEKMLQAEIAASRQPGIS